ncbi:hypothetical protein ACVWXL_009039 [Bradyrhizobium sp. GM22.5]
MLLRAKKELQIPYHLSTNDDLQRSSSRALCYRFYAACGVQDPGQRALCTFRVFWSRCHLSDETRCDRNKPCVFGETQRMLYAAPPIDRSSQRSAKGGDCFNLLAPAR